MQRVLACVLMILGLAAAAAGPQRPDVAPAASAEPSAPDIARNTPFTHFGAARALALRGDGASASVDFGARGDELTVRASLKLRYAVPATAPGGLQLRLVLNDQPLGAFPLVPDPQGEPAERVVELDPRLVVGYNRLTMTLVAPAPADGAEAPTVEVSGASELDLLLRPLKVADELSALPEPFFDKHDQRRLEVPFVFATRPSNETLRAAGVVASWLGSLATWRGARFPASLGEPAPGHAIAFATNTERAPFLDGLPPATGPTLRLMTNPADGRSKLLVIAGRTSEEVLTAARALVLRKVVLSGAVVAVKPFEEPAARAAWEAPSIVRLDRAMKLSELVDDPLQLTVTGRPPALDPVRIEMRVPPDLWTGDSLGVPLRYKAQYTPPACAADTWLDVAIDGQALLTESLPTPRGTVTEAREIYLPGWRLSPRSKLSLGLRYTMKDDVACHGVRPGATRFTLLPDSTIDFSGFERRARMPDLAGFARLGFPFTRLPDLADTVVVLPATPVAGDLSTMLGLLGRLGEATGAPATRVRVAGPEDETALRDAELLVIGTPTRQALFDRWAGALPVGLGRGRTVPVSLDRGGPVVTVLGFESPLTRGRSVVAVSAVTPEQTARVLDALDDEEERDAFAGGAAFLMKGKVESAQVGRAYMAGPPPPWDAPREWLFAHPELLAALAGFAAALLILGAWGLWRAAATRAKAAA